MENHALFAGIGFIMINSLAYLNSKTAFIISNPQKDFHHDNLSFFCVHFYNHNCLNILGGNVFSIIQVKNQKNDSKTFTFYTIF